MNACDSDRGRSWFADPQIQPQLSQTKVSEQRTKSSRWLLDVLECESGIAAAQGTTPRPLTKSQGLCCLWGMGSAISFI
jgi:hypothetical protein